MPRRMLLRGLFIALVVAALELPSYVGITLLGHSGLFYDRAAPRQDYADYLARRDLDLGWAPRGRTASAPGEARPDPTFSSTIEPCVSLFGDSFTYSSEVEDGQAWGARLAARLGCPVANYGVGGYGSDQAYLLFQAMPAKGRVVVLNHVSENILRNVNQYRNLLYPGPEFNFKPRFIVRDGNLALVAMPDIAPSDIAAFKARPERFLQHDYFLPGGPSGVQAISVPYSLAVLKVAAMHYHVRAQLANVPRHAAFYRPDHPSGGLQVTSEILRAFDVAARARGQVALVTIIPTCRDLKYMQASSSPPWEPLKAMLAEQRIRVVDFAEQMLRRLGSASPDRLYGDCSSHFTAAGYQRLADIMSEVLRSDPALLPGPAR